jgi:hypothetical protein
MTLGDPGLSPETSPMADFSMASPSTETLKLLLNVYAQQLILDSDYQVERTRDRSIVWNRQRLQIA